MENNKVYCLSDLLDEVDHTEADVVNAHTAIDFLSDAVKDMREMREANKRVVASAVGHHMDIIISEYSYIDYSDINGRHSTYSFLDGVLVKSLDDGYAEYRMNHHDFTSILMRVAYLISKKIGYQ